MRAEKGIILKGLSGLYTVCLDGGDMVSCKGRGIFRHEHQTLQAGDRVVVEFEEGSAVISEICERKNLFIRPPISNLDIIFVVIAAANPTPSLAEADKLITVAEHKNAEPVIIVTKADIDDEGAQRIADIYRKSGFCVFISAAGGSCADEVSEYIKANAQGKVCAFAGASGVGKSTLLNAMFPSLMLETGEVSQKTARGKHTTKRVELYPFSKLFGDTSYTGFLADTPGFGILDFTRFDFYTKDDLPYLFREFEPYLTKCRYTKCTHTKEDGCAILEAVKIGDITAERHADFLEIYNQIKDKHEWDKK